MVKSEGEASFHLVRANFLSIKKYLIHCISKKEKWSYLPYKQFEGCIGKKVTLSSVTIMKK